MSKHPQRPFSRARWALLLMAVLTACAPSKKELLYEPFDREKILRYREVGFASWYGEEYHGRKTANGEVYDMYAMTAAHRTLPFNTFVRVTNMENGKKAELRINDRGPFVSGRIIDLSQSGARAIEILTCGTAKVSVEVTGFAGSASSFLQGNFSLQVGAFESEENAQRLRSTLSSKYGGVRIVLWEGNRKRLYRVRLGSFRSEAEARRTGEFLRKENLAGFVVRED
jgi:rare lipoprotein A